MAIKSELEAYLRVDQLRCRSFFSALHRVTGLTVEEYSAQRSAAPTCGLAGLCTDMGSLICVHTGQQVETSTCSLSTPLLLFAPGGGVSVSFCSDQWKALDVPAWVGPGVAFRLRFSETGQLLIIRPLKGRLVEDVSIGVDGVSAVAPLVQQYLEDIRFYFNHDHARDLTQGLFMQLASTETDGHAPVVQTQVPVDWRLQRAIEKIKQGASWEFNLQELASYAGASERNLYYLMKRYTGMTPYRFYQRQRLIRVRQRLVNCQAGEFHISRYAADERFSHLGRFAALYREHFGELPSTTIRCRQRLCEAEPEVEALPQQELVKG